MSKTVFDKLELGKWYRYEALRYDKDFISAQLKYIGRPENVKPMIVDYMDVATTRMESIPPDHDTCFKVIIEFSPRAADWLEMFWSSMPDHDEGSWNWQREFFFRPETVLR